MSTPSLVVMIAIFLIPSVGLLSTTALRLIAWNAVGRRLLELRETAVNRDFAGGHEAAVRRREKGCRRPGRQHVDRDAGALQVLRPCPREVAHDSLQPSDRRSV